MTSGTLWAIGDVQGCWRTLKRLLRAIGWKRGKGELWLTGDLVNRGPRSLDVLRWAADQGDDALTTVLGNHDLHLLAMAAGFVEPRRTDTLGPILAARDRDALLGWLRRRPFVVRRENRLLVHAGLLPEWSAEHAARLGRELSSSLTGRGGRAVLRALATRGFTGSSPEGKRLARLTRVAGVLTRVRTLGPDGRPHGGFSGPPADAPKGFRPWFEARGRRSARTTIVFGHWAALGLLVRPHLVALDTGCVWGNRLTAIRLSDRKVVSEPASG